MCSSWKTDVFGSTSIQKILADLLFITEDVDIADYADDSTPYVSAENVDEVEDSLEQAVNTFKWFKDNLINGNADKRYLLVSSSNFGLKKKVTT